MTTVSFQVDEDTKAVLDELARREGISRSDVLRQFLKHQKFLLGVKRLQKDLAPQLKKHGLVTEDDFERFLG